mmetsp:Transcript_8036/g.17966  ORF Transcript_8036/g.17966 Transcript_8036/m.17966 type:complete len:586 (+) Transcript_8036:52-1809(+)
MGRAALLILGWWSFSTDHVRATRTHQEWAHEDGLLRYQANRQYCISTSASADAVAEGSPLVLWHCQRGHSFAWDFDGELLRWRSQSQFCLGFAGQGESGTALTLQPCTSSLASSVRWRFDGERLRPVGSPGYVVGVREGVADGAPLVLQPCTVSHFRWDFAAETGRVRFEAAPQLCLSLTKGFRFLAGVAVPEVGTPMSLVDCSSQQEDYAQIWRTSGGGDSNESARLCLHNAPTRCVGASVSRKDGAAVTLRDSEAAEEAAWEFHDGRLRSTVQPDYCLTVRDAVAAVGSQVVVWMCDAPGPRVTSVANYLHISPEENEFAWFIDGDLIRSKMDPRYCVTVREGLAGDGADVIMWHCGVGKEAKWKVDGRQLKTALDPRLCLSVREGRAGDGSDIILWRCKARRSNQWLVQGDHILFARSPQYAMSIRGGELMDGADVILWSARSAAFEWQMSRGRIRFQAESHLCLSVVRGRAGAGSDVQLGHCRRDEGMLWDMESGQVRLRSRPELCLAVRESKPVDNADVIVWPCAEAPDRWSFSNQDKRLRYHSDNHMEYCMSVRDGQAVSGSKATVWSCDRLTKRSEEL